MIVLHEEFCFQDHACPVVRVCPAGAISQNDRHSAPVIDMEKCLGCRRCTKLCGVFRQD
ncbi:MAG: 4Fe-4S dicluster domain-containing protein [Candidatus Woesearchaeota archaeon]